MKTRTRTSYRLTLVKQCLLSVAAYGFVQPTANAAPKPSIVGGEEAETCQWPSVVALEQTGNPTPHCSGTLVAANVVVTAGHCIDFAGEQTQVVFGESSSAPAMTIGATCTPHPSWTDSKATGFDVGVCVLEQDAPVSPTPLLGGCEADLIGPGVELTVAGFGATFLNESSAQGIGQKRSITVPVVNGSADAVVVQTEVSNQGTCLVDSGGPVLVQLDDGGWRLAGVNSLLILDGPPPPGENICLAGTLNQATAAWHHLGWLEDTSGIDVTPCHDADGTWAPTEACGGFPTELHRSAGTWERACSGEVSGLSQTCGDPFASGETTGGDTTGGDTTGGDTTGADESGETTVGTGDDRGSSGTTGVGTTDDASSEGSSSSSASAADAGEGCNAGRGSSVWMLLVLLGLGRRGMARRGGRALRARSG